MGRAQYLIGVERGAFGKGVELLSSGMRAAGISASTVVLTGRKPVAEMKAPEYASAQPWRKSRCVS